MPSPLYICQHGTKGGHACGLPLRLWRNGQGNNIASSFWACPMWPKHPDQMIWRGDGRLGDPADGETRYLRAMAHAAFDTAWNPDGTLSMRSKQRERAYHKLAAVMGVSRHELHFGMMKAEQLRRAIEICNTWLRALGLSEITRASLKQKHVRSGFDPRTS